MSFRDSPVPTERAAEIQIWAGDSIDISDGFRCKITKNLTSREMNFKSQQVKIYKVQQLVF